MDRRRSAKRYWSPESGRHCGYDHAYNKVVGSLGGDCTSAMPNVFRIAGFWVLRHYRTKVRPFCQRVFSWTIDTAFVVLISLSVFGAFATSIAIWIAASVDLKDPHGESISLVRATAIFFETAWDFVFSPSLIGPFEREVVATYANVWVFSLSIFSVVVSSLYIFKEKKALRSSLPYREHAFSSTEEYLNDQATPIMRRYYSSAEQVLVLSGDYDWLFSSNGMRIADRLQELAGKDSATLLSYKAPDAVLREWKRHESSHKYKILFEKIIFLCPVRFKASLITQRSGSTSFIFLSDMDMQTGGPAAEALRHYKIFEYHSGGHARPLMNIIDKLCSLAREDTQTREQVAVAARAQALSDAWWNRP